MDNIITAWSLIAVCINVGTDFLLLFFAKHKGVFSKEYDERPIIGRGQAYKAAFFTLLAYNFACAIINCCGIKWWEPEVGLLIGRFVSVTVFAVTAITKDALHGIHTQSKSVISVFLLVCVLNAINFVVQCINDSVIKDGVLSLGFIPLAAAVCFAVMLIAFLLHNKKVKLLEESGENNEES